MSVFYRENCYIFRAQVPLSEDQYDRVQAENEIYNGMSLTKRRAFRDLQEWVC